MAVRQYVVVSNMVNLWDGPARDPRTGKKNKPRRFLRGTKINAEETLEQIVDLVALRGLALVEGELKPDGTTAKAPRPVTVAMAVRAQGAADDPVLKPDAEVLPYATTAQVAKDAGVI